MKFGKINFAIQGTGLSDIQYDQLQTKILEKFPNQKLGEFGAGHGANLLLVADSREDFPSRENRLHGKSSTLAQALALWKDTLNPTRIKRVKLSDGPETLEESVSQFKLHPEDSHARRFQFVA